MAGQKRTLNPGPQEYSNQEGAGGRRGAAEEAGHHRVRRADTKPDFVEHHPYQQGVLISYRDRSQVDTDTVVHPGQGRSMDLDAHPHRPE